jgi:hypothetical protein
MPSSLSALPFDEEGAMMTSKTKHNDEEEEQELSDETDDLY